MLTDPGILPLKGMCEQEQAHAGQRITSHRADVVGAADRTGDPASLPFAAPPLAMYALVYMGAC